VSKADAAAWTTVELNEVIFTIRDTWFNEVFLKLGGNLIWRSIAATDISVYGGAQVVNTDEAGANGAASGGTAPGNVTWCETLRTGHVGRAFRGRNYLPGLPEDALNGNEVYSTFANDIIAGENLWAAALTAAGYVWCIVSRTLNGVTRTPPVALPITGVGYADLSIDSQRRRLNKRGS
jgi:hypothetical protein